MVYLLHQLSQKPEKMAQGGMSLLPGETNQNAVGQGASVGSVPGSQQTFGQSLGDASGNIAGGAEKFERGLTTGTVNPLEGLGQVIGGVGGAAKGLASEFTAQNEYQAMLAPTQQMDYTGLIGESSGNALQGYKQYLQNLMAQKNLAGTFEGQAAGTAPSLAQQQLAQTTGANVQNQAALLASQRGANANAGMNIRNAARAGADINQKSAAQGAELRLQEQQQAQQNLMNLYNQIGNQNISQQGANTNLFGTATGALNAQNNTLVNNYAQAQGINSQVAQNNANAVNKTLGGGLGGLASILNEGGEVGVDGKQVPVGYADGGSVIQVPHLNGMPEDTGQHYNPYGGGQQGPQSFAGQYLNNGPKGPGQQKPGMIKGLMNMVFGDKSKGGNPQIKVGDGMTGSGGEAGMGPLADSQLYGASLGEGAGAVGAGEAALGESAAAEGLGAGALAGAGEAEGGGALLALLANNLRQKVPGKASVPGDSEKNDTVHALLSPGEIVVPRTAAADPEKAAAFAKSVAMRHSSRKGKR